MKNAILIGFLFFWAPSFAIPHITLKHTSPNKRDECKQTLFAKLSALSAGNSIHIAMYTLSNPDIIGFLRTFANNGGKICILVDEQQRETSRKMKDNLLTLAQHTHGHVKVRVLGHKGTGSTPWKNVETLHEKFAVLKKGESTELMIGSYNWTWTASDRNYENCMFLRRGENEDINNTILIAKSRFDELWRKSEATVLPSTQDLECLFELTVDERAALKKQEEAALSSPPARGRSRGLVRVQMADPSPIKTPTRK